MVRSDARGAAPVRGEGAGALGGVLRSAGRGRPVLPGGPGRDGRAGARPPRGPADGSARAVPVHGRHAPRAVGGPALQARVAEGVQGLGRCPAHSRRGCGQPLRVGAVHGASAQRALAGDRSAGEQPRLLRHAARTAGRWPAARTGRARSRVRGPHERQERLPVERPGLPRQRLRDRARTARTLVGSDVTRRLARVPPATAGSRKPRRRSCARGQRAPRS